MEEPTAWCFLLAHDREWLDTVAPPRRAMVVRNGWREVDIRLAREAHRAREALLAMPGLPRRLTFARMADAMGRRTTLFRRDARLPLTMHVMRSAVDTTARLLRRRMTWALSGAAGKRPATWSEFSAMIGLWRLPLTKELRLDAASRFGSRFDTG